jgi:hypothetical protein
VATDIAALYTSVVGVLGRAGRRMLAPMGARVALAWSRGVVVAGALVACGATPAVRGSGGPGAASGDQIALFRDVALVRRRLALTLPAGRSTTAGGVVAPAADVVVLSRGGLTAARVVAGAGGGALAVEAPAAGRYEVEVAYLTFALSWQARYALAIDRAATTGALRGEVMIDNRGPALAGGALTLIDATRGAWAEGDVAALAAAVARRGPTAGHVIAPLALGVAALPPGVSTRRLLDDDPPRRLRPALIYDPIGPRLDVATALFEASPGYGVASASTADLHEADELALPPTTALPAGPLAVTAPAGHEVAAASLRLFDVASAAPQTATLPRGVARGLSGARTRRELTYDAVERRLTEEFVITVTNQRAEAVDVVVREHLYRGQNWVLPYDSTGAASQEGPQQIRLPLHVPAHGEAHLMYVVRYTPGDARPEPGAAGATSPAGRHARAGGRP